MTDYRHQEVDWNGQYECPVCHSENIETEDSGEYDSFYYYAMYCEDCGAVFKQWYSMTPHSVDYSTKEEYEESYRATQQALQALQGIHQHALNAAASVPPSELPPDMPVPPPPVYIESIRHNIDLAKDAQHIEVAQCRCDSATRNPLIPHVNWQAISEALSDS